MDDFPIFDTKPTTWWVPTGPGTPRVTPAPCLLGALFFPIFQVPKSVVFRVFVEITYSKTTSHGRKQHREIIRLLMILANRSPNQDAWVEFWHSNMWKINCQNMFQHLSEHRLTNCRMNHICHMEVSIDHGGTPSSDSFLAGISKPLYWGFHSHGGTLQKDGLWCTIPSFERWMMTGTVPPIWQDPRGLASPATCWFNHLRSYVRAAKYIYI